VKISVDLLCVISAFERSLMQACTRKPCCGRETAQCRCKIRYLSKFTATSLGSPCDSMALVIAYAVVLCLGVAAVRRQTGDRKVAGRLPAAGRYQVKG